MGFQLPFPQLVSWISEPSTVPRAQLLWGWRIALPRRRIEPSYPCSFGSQTMDGCCFGCFNPKKPGRYSIPLRSWCCYVVVVFLRYKLNFPIKMFQSFIYTVYNKWVRQSFFPSTQSPGSSDVEHLCFALP